MTILPFFVSCPPNLTDLVAQEVGNFGGSRIREVKTGVYFTGDISSAYRTCMWSRIATRVFAIIAEVPADTTDVLYENAQKLEWESHFDNTATFAVFTTGTAREYSTHFATLRVKDAIADRFSAKLGHRPNVNTSSPEITIHLHLFGGKAELSIDLSGESLHRRGYRERSGPAPLKENIAAAVLMRAGWAAMARQGLPFVDPMCGSGTLPIEAALIAADIAPALGRARFGFTRWKHHEKRTWAAIKREAADRRAVGLRTLPTIVGYDTDGRSLNAARQNAEAAGLSDQIRFDRRDLDDATPPAGAPEGLVAVNPPYGVRIAHEGGLEHLYSTLGSILVKRFQGWHVAILTGDRELAKNTGLSATRVNTLYNGRIECVLAHFQIYRRGGEAHPAPDRSAEPSEDAPVLAAVERRTEAGGTTLPSGETRHEADADRPSSRTQKGGAAVYRNDPMYATYAEMFGNRIVKNLRSLANWRKTSGATSYRLYDADMPEFSAAVDFYEGTWLHVQEYAPPSEIETEKARLRLQVILDVLSEKTGVAPDGIFLKTRERQRHMGQYEKQDSRGEFYEMHEGGLSFLINLRDYLDTGIFLDHRITRDMIRREAGGKRFLNLFSYTGTASVYAADGGAVRTVSVDNSNTYIEWARENFALNQIFDESHELIREEARLWLSRCRETFDLIFVDPPTFSRSKRSKETFQVQRDHVELIKAALKLIEPNGAVLFSNNFGDFAFDYESFGDCTISDLTADSIPYDFRRTPKVHTLYRIEPYRKAEDR